MSLILSFSIPYAVYTFDFFGRTNEAQMQLSSSAKRSAGQPAFVHLPPHHATIPAHLPFANAAAHLIFTVHQLYIPHQPVITISIYMPTSLNRLQGVCWPIGEFINILEFVCFCIYWAWPKCPPPNQPAFLAAKAKAARLIF